MNVDLGDLLLLFAGSAGLTFGHEEDAQVPCEHPAQRPDGRLR